MKTVLVTGATGFIGSNTINTLVEMDYKIHAITTRDIKNSQNATSVSWHKVNLFNFSDVGCFINEIKPTHLLHFAWYAEHGKFWDSFENYGWMYTTHNLVEKFIHNGGKRIVISGSCAEYEWKYTRYVENKSSLYSNTLYGQVKNLTRLSIERLAIDNNISFGWGRIFYLYGCGEKAGRLVPLILDSLMNGKRFPCTDGRQLRDYMHVQDVARAFCLFLDSNVNGTVNIASGRVVEIRKIIEIVAEKLGANKLVDFGALKSRQNDPHEICADVSRLKNEIGFEERWTIYEGLRNVVDQTIKYK
jgi:nucleoside-diphosphate-sugar epimerase